jgi:hypothetical protein
MISRRCVLSCCSFGSVSRLLLVFPSWSMNVCYRLGFGTGRLNRLWRLATLKMRTCGSKALIALRLTNLEAIRPRGIGSSADTAFGGPRSSVYVSNAAAVAVLGGASCGTYAHAVGPYRHRLIVGGAARRFFVGGLILKS